MQDIDNLCCLNNIPWEMLRGSSMLISGATGLLGSCLIDAVMVRNESTGLKCRIFALGRNPAKAWRRFNKWTESPLFSFVTCDVNAVIDISTHCDYVVHLASNTHPVIYATDPIGTITTNLIGTRNMLDYAVTHSAKRFVFASSNEIYGENRGEVETFDEYSLGYIDCNTLRAGYPESKRCGESLCQAYRKQQGIEIVIPRFTRSYGPTLQLTDSKALSQFLINGLKGEDIVLKSPGNQLYSYTYASDAVSGLLIALLRGEDGNAYNIAEESFDMSLKEVAQIVADAVGSQVVFDIPDDIESIGFSKVTKARLDGSKMRSLGWQAMYDLKKGIPRTLEALKQRV